VLLYSIIDKIDRWDKVKIKEELSDLRYELQSIDNFQKACYKTQLENERKIIAAYSLASGNNVLRADGHMHNIVSNVIDNFSDNEKDAIDKFIKKYYDEEYEQASSMWVLKKIFYKFRDKHRKCRRDK
jgi:hypothetical protein